MPGKPFAFELHRADVSQRRMQPGFVVPEQPRNGFVFGLTPGHEALPVQALDLQRAKQRLAAGIDAPMSSRRSRVFQIGQDEWVQLTNDVALQTTVDLLL